MLISSPCVWELPCYLFRCAFLVGSAPKRAGSERETPFTRAEATAAGLHRGVRERRERRSKETRKQGKKGDEITLKCVFILICTLYKIYIYI